MEIIARIEKIGSMSQRQYTDSRTNEQKVFKSIGVTLRAGKDVIYAEAVQEQADALEMDVTVNKTVRVWCSYFVRLMFNKREYTDQQGVTHYQTEVNLVSWEPLYIPVREH
ncbi:MAG: hypothetical protein J6I31_06425 [Prevotella sp.]|nr:hypothetical protein [Prevotella sp.]